MTTSTYPTGPRDGTPRFVHDLARAVAVHADVTVLAPHAPGAKLQEVADGVDIRRFSYFVPRTLQRLALGDGMRDNLRSSWLARIQVPTFLVAQGAAIRRMVRGRAFDVVNAHWIVPSGLTAAWACGDVRATPLVLHVHAGDVYLLRKSRVGAALCRYVVGRSRVILAAGSHVRDTLDGVLGRTSGAVLRPMGVDYGRFASVEAGEVLTEFPEGFILFFGRMSEKKGAIYLVRAMAKIIERQPGLGLVLIGDGPERRRLEDEANRLGIGSAVRFPGRKPHDDIVRYLHACRAAVVPSIIDTYGETEGMPTVVLEAMAAGVRVVGSAVDGIPDVLRHRENGWLCREKDPEDLAEKLFDALAAPDDSPVLAGASATAARNDWRAVGDAYLAHLDDAASFGSGPSALRESVSGGVEP